MTKKEYITVGKVSLWKATNKDGSPALDKDGQTFLQGNIVDDSGNKQFIKVYKQASKNNEKSPDFWGFVSEEVTENKPNDEDVPF